MRTHLLVLRNNKIMKYRIVKKINEDWKNVFIVQGKMFWFFWFPHMENDYYWWWKVVKYNEKEYAKDYIDIVRLREKNKRRSKAKAEVVYKDY